MKLIQTAFGVACITLATSATTFAQAPLNDDCPSPVITGTGAFPFDVNSANATDSVVPQPACASRPSNLSDVFFTWTCPADGNYEFTTEDHNTIGYDTVMVLYANNACDGTGCIDYDDDDGPGFGSSIDTTTAAVPGPLTAGDTYVIQIGGWSASEVPTATNILTINLTLPENDDCPSPTITGTGVFPFDANSANATDSLVPQPACASRPATIQDLFFTWTCPADGDYVFETEDHATIGYDTVMVLYDGNACDGSGCIDYDDDDGPGFGSMINTATAGVPGPLTAGDTYVIQVGGWSSGTVPTATNLLTISALIPPPPTPDNCAETTFANNNAGAVGGAAYFDVTGAGPLTFEGLETNFNGAAGVPVGMEMWTIAGSTYAGNEVGGAWVQVAVDDGTGISAGVGVPTSITFTTPVTLPAGLNAVALVTVGLGHAYTNGNGTNENSVSNNGAVILDLGAGSNVPFSGSIFSPRVWNGMLCEVGVPLVGTPFCDPMNVNSSGLSTTLTGTMGSGVGSDLNLQVNNGPAGRLGYMLVGMGNDEPGIAIGAGFFCLAPGPASLFGRYNVSGTTSNSVGFFDAAGVMQNAVGTATSSGGAGFDVPLELPNIGGTIMAGDTFHFQMWHRDENSGTNFSNGLSVTF